MKNHYANSYPKKFREEIVNLYNDLSVPAFTYSYGITVGYKINYRWKIETGLWYSQRKERLKNGILFIHENYFKIGGIWTSYVDTTGMCNCIHNDNPYSNSYSWENILGPPDLDSLFTKYMIHDELTEFKHDIFQLPVIIRHYYKFKRLNNSVSLGVIFKNEERWPDFILGLGIEYPLGEKIRLEIEPQFKHTASTADGSFDGIFGPFKSRYQDISLKIGIQYNFLKNKDTRFYTH